MGSAWSSNNGQIASKVRNGAEEYQPLALVPPNNTKLLCPINYMYNYLPRHTKWLKPQPVSLDCIFAESEHRPAFLDREANPENFVLLDTQAAGFPLHTGLERFRQSKHWRAGFEAARELLELFARDQRCSEVILSDTRSMAGLAEEQLKTAIGDTYTRFSIYMFAAADESQMQLLAQIIILVFIFDDVWENAASSTMKALREDFVSRLEDRTSVCTTDTPLERRLNAIRDGFLGGDEEENGGAEVLHALIEFCHHPQPEEFGSTRAYLDYRLEDVASRYLWACTKFSIRSRVDLDNEKLRRFLRCLGDQISIANDLASSEKETCSFENGRASSMINIVHVIQRVDGVDEEAAKSMAYAWQLRTENDILRELEEMKRLNELSLDDWRFVDACLATASGNILGSVVMSRYGGEDARIA